MTKHDIDIPKSKETLKFKRHELPQIPARHLGDFLDYLNTQGISSKVQDVPADNLKPTQDQFDKNKVRGLMHQRDKKPTISSYDGYILDGHHRWLADYNLGTNHQTIRINLPIHDLIRKAHEYDGSFIKKINEARYRKEIFLKSIL